MEPSTVDIVNNASSKNSSSKEYTPISSISCKLIFGQFYFYIIV